MGKTPDLHAVAEQNGVEIVSFRLPNADSMSTELNGRCYIGLDSTRQLTQGEENARLGHELGHCLYGGFYTRAAPYDLRERHEVRADRWYIRRAIPRKTLFRLLRDGYDAWEIAEQLDTTEDYVRRAYYYYKDVSTME